MSVWFAAALKVALYIFPAICVFVAYALTGGNSGLGDMLEKLLGKLSPPNRNNSVQNKKVAEEILNVAKFIAVPPSILIALLSTPAAICGECSYYHSFFEQHFLFLIFVGEAIVICLLYIDVLKRHVVKAIMITLVVSGLVILYNVLMAFTLDYTVLLVLCVSTVCLLYARLPKLAGLSACAALLLYGLGGTAVGQLYIGLYYSALSDDAKAAHFYKLAADGGNADAENSLGAFYADGLGELANNDQEAARLFRLAADQGNKYGQYNLAGFYEMDHGVLPKDDQEAARLYRSAADQGYDDAQVALGDYYATGRGGISKDDHEAARLFRLAADQGNVTGEYHLALFYEAGLGGLAEDEHEAARLYKLAADKGDAGARFHLGQYYKIGRGGLRKDGQEATRLYRLAAAQGYAPAQYELAYSYAYGLGVSKDEREAARILKLAVEQGDADAEFLLGYFYAYGLGGLNRDGREAERLYRMAADQGNVYAQHNLDLINNEQKRLFDKTPANLNGGFWVPH